MKIDKRQNVPAGPATEKDARDVRMQVLMSDKDGAPNFIMRVFEIGPGGNTPFHSHPWEHEVYVLDGKGTIRTKAGDHPIERDSFALVAPGEEHQFVNTGAGDLRFICVIPIPEPGR